MEAFYSKQISIYSDHLISIQNPFTVQKLIEQIITSGEKTFRLVENMYGNSIEYFFYYENKEDRKTYFLNKNKHIEIHMQTLSSFILRYQTILQSINEDTVFTPEKLLIMIHNWCQALNIVVFQIRWINPNVKLVLKKFAETHLEREKFEILIQYLKLMFSPINKNLIASFLFG